VPSQRKEPPPLPLDDDAFEEVPLLLKEIEKAIAQASGNEERVLRVIAEHLRSVDRKVVHLNEGSRSALQDLSKDLAAVHGGIDMIRLAPSAPDEEAIGDAVALELMEVFRRFDRIEKRFDALDREIALTANDASASRALGEEAARYVQKIPLVLDASVDGMVASLGAKVAAEAAARASERSEQEAQQTRELVRELQEREARKRSTAILDVLSVDIVSEEAEPVEAKPKPSAPILPFDRSGSRQAKHRTFLGAVAMVTLTFTTAAFSMSGPTPNVEARPTTEASGQMSLAADASVAPEAPKPPAHKQKKHKKH
jgi:hypothetical protein